MTKQSAERDRSVGIVYDGIAAITRRAAARSRRLAAPLSFVEHSLLSFIGTTPGCRATDVAASFHLNRSTVSRQVAALFALDLVEYAADDASPGRGRVLQMTEHGRAQLQASADVQREALQARLSGWSDGDIDKFAAMLSRFNETD